MLCVCASAVSSAMRAVCAQEMLPSAHTLDNVESLEVLQAWASFLLIFCAVAVLN